MKGFRPGSRNAASLLFVSVGIPCAAIGFVVFNHFWPNSSDTALYVVAFVSLVPAIITQVLYERRHRNDPVGWIPFDTPGDG